MSLSLFFPSISTSLSPPLPFPLRAAHYASVPPLLSPVLSSLVVRTPFAESGEAPHAHMSSQIQERKPGLYMPRLSHSDANAHLHIRVPGIRGASHVRLSRRRLEDFAETCELIGDAWGFTWDQHRHSLLYSRREKPSIAEVLITTDTDWFNFWTYNTDAPHSQPVLYEFDLVSTPQLPAALCDPPSTDDVTEEASHDGDAEEATPDGATEETTPPHEATATSNKSQLEKAMELMKEVKSDLQFLNASNAELRTDLARLERAQQDLASKVTPLHQASKDVCNDPSTPRVLSEAEPSVPVSDAVQTPPEPQPRNAASATPPSASSTPSGTDFANLLAGIVSTVSTAVREAGRRDDFTPARPGMDDLSDERQAPAQGQSQRASFEGDISRVLERCGVPGQTLGALLGSILPEQRSPTPRATTREDSHTASSRPYDDTPPSEPLRDTPVRPSTASAGSRKDDVGPTSPVTESNLGGRTPMLGSSTATEGDEARSRASTASSSSSSWQLMQNFEDDMESIRKRSRGQGQSQSPTDVPSYVGTRDAGSSSRNPNGTLDAASDVDPGSAPVASHSFIQAFEAMLANTDAAARRDNHKAT